METSELFSHREQHDSAPAGVLSAEPAETLIFSDRPTDRLAPRADAQSS